MKFIDYYTEKELLGLLQLSKYKLGKYALPFGRFGGNQIKIFKVEDVDSLVEKDKLADDEYEKRLRHLNSQRRRLTGLDGNDWVTIQELLSRFPISRQRVNQLKDRPELTRIKVWGQWLYDKQGWKKNLLSSRRIANWLQEGNFSGTNAQFLAQLEAW